MNKLYKPLEESVGAAYNGQNGTSQLDPIGAGVLEEIASSPTKVDGQQDFEYNIDNCHCPPCGCVKTDIRVILSPAGVATAATISMAMSAIQ